MEITQSLSPILASILIGALIGLEREKTKIESHGISPVGVRTDILVCLFGAIAALFGQINIWIFFTCLTALLVLTISGYIYMSITHGRVGITTEISTILVFLFGAMCAWGFIQLAGVLAILTALILSVREYLHNAVAKISQYELSDTIKFAVIAFIILPFLPNKSYDAYVLSFLPKITNNYQLLSQINILNPYNIWLLIVIISGISFVGYIMVKVLGKNKGISFSGLVGGLYSSTATTITLSEKSKDTPNIKTPYIAAIALACGISLFKNFIIVKTLNDELFIKCFATLALMFSYLLLAGFYLTYKSRKDKIEHHNNHLETPFSLKKAIKLGTYITLALLFSEIILAYFSTKFYYVVAGIASFFASDDGIIISASSSSGKLLTLEAARTVVIMASFLNMAQKVFYMHFFGNKKLVKPLAIIILGLLLVTLFGLVYLN